MFEKSLGQGLVQKLLSTYELSFLFCIDLGPLLHILHRAEVVLPEEGDGAGVTAAPWVLRLMKRG